MLAAPEPVQRPSRRSRVRLFVAIILVLALLALVVLFFLFFVIR
jgi:hypothetical protein